MADRSSGSTVTQGQSPEAGGGAGFTVTHLRFAVRATTMMQFGAQPGSQLRGALFETLRRHECALPANEEPTARHTAVCPVCSLLSPRSPDAARGHTPPPPFALQPPPGDGRIYRPGQMVSFGVSLLGDQRALFPYLVIGLSQVGRQGVGRGRGQFEIERVEAVHPLKQAREDLFDAGGRVRLPALVVCAADVAAAAAALPSDRVTLNFRTPTRLVAEGRPVARPHFAVLIARLLERLDLLLAEYAPAAGGTPYAELGERAGGITLARDETRWLSIRSGSRRQGRTTPIGGFVGRATYGGDLRPFLPWLLWGQSVQVGKNTAKGDGWYEVETTAQTP